MSRISRAACHFAMAGKRSLPLWQLFHVRLSSAERRLRWHKMLGKLAIMIQKGLTPMLGVADVRRSLDFYNKAFGFEEVNRYEHDGELCWAYVRRDLVELMFTKVGEIGRDHQERIGRAKLFFYFNPDDVVGLHAALKGQGFAVSDLRVTFYRMKEFELEDPDGYQLWFGQATTETPTECD